MRTKIRFRELATVKIQDTRSLIISSVNDGANGFTIAQQLKVNEDGRTTSVFLKGGIQIPDVKTLIGIRDALNVAIARLDSSEKEKDIEWDG